MKKTEAKTLRAFRRQVLKVRHAIESLRDDAGLSVRIAVRDGHTTSEFDQPEEPSKIQVAVLMRPLLADKSAISCSIVWPLARELFDIDGEVSRQIDDALERARAGWMAVVVNGRSVSQQEIYDALASGEFFGEDRASAELLKALRFGPMTQIVWLQFYSFCYDMYGVAEAILAQIEPRIRSDAPEAVEPRCVYCLTTVGAFTSEEHVIPEAFGNDEAVLPRGSVCDKCNNVCSSLDQYLTDFEAISLQRVINTPYTKKGKLPRAEFANLVVEKRMPRVLRITDRSNGKAFRTFDTQADGSFRFNLNVRSRQPIDYVRLARALCKIGLGMVAFQAGRDCACLPRYDITRRFIRGEEVLKNSIIMSTHATPHSQVGFTWLEQDVGTPCIADFYGFVIGFNLEAEPKLTLDERDSDFANFKLFPIGG